MILDTVPMSGGWFANSLHGAMAAYPTKADELDKRQYVRFWHEADLEGWAEHVRSAQVF
jgi:hypothetical protein